MAHKIDYPSRRRFLQMYIYTEKHIKTTENNIILLTVALCCSKNIYLKHDTYNNDSWQPR